MSSIQPYSPNAGASLTGRGITSRAGRQIGRITAGTEVQVVQVAGLAAIESAKLDALQGLATQALHGVALVSQHEVQLAQMVPMASGRLAAIGDMFALAATEIVASIPRRLG